MIDRGIQIMDYQAQAMRFLSLRAKFRQVPEDCQISAMSKGTTFVLNYLATHETITHPKELSEEMSVSTARIASLLNQMEKKGLIAREPDPEDNRQIVVRLTELGSLEIYKIRADVISLTAKMLEDLGPEDAAEYIRIQERILQNFLKQK